MKPHAVPASLSARRLLLSAFCALACSISALAQTPPAPPSGNEEVYVLEPFTVQSSENTYVVANSMVGTRVNIPLIDAPFSAQVVTDQLIRETGAGNIQEALRYVSSVRSSSNIYEEFAIRGFNSGAPLRNYFNVPGALQARGDNAEYDRIEVLKGPTGLLYGNGQPGGRINVVTKKPLAVARRSLDFEVGDYEFYRTVADFTGPLAKLGDGQLLYRAIGAYQDSGGFRDYEHTSRTLLNGQLEWRSRRLSFRVEQRYLRQKEDAEAFILLPLGPGATPAFFLMPDREYNTAGPNTYANFREYNTYTELIWNIAENWTLRNGSSYSETYYDALRRVGAGLNAAGTHVNAIPVYNDNKNSATNIQTDLTGQFKLPFGKLTAVLGQIYGENDSRAIQWNAPGSPFAVLDRSARTYAVPAFPSASYNRTQYQLNEGKNERYYAMLQLTTLNDRLTVLGGVGRSHVEPKVTNLQPAVPTVSGSSSWNTSPQMGASFRIRKDLTAYVMHGESFSPNGNFPGQPEEGESWEAGLKFGSERLSGTLAWFDTTRESIEVQAFDPILARNVPSIAGKQTATGVELDLYAKLTEQTEVIFSYAHLDTENVIPDVRFAAAAGTRLGDAPTDQFKIWAKQTLPDMGALRNLWAGVGVIYVGDMVADHDAARFQLVAPSYTRVDLGFGAEHKLSGGQKLVFKVNVENLFDEDYVEKQITRGWPRRFKASVGLKF